MIAQITPDITAALLTMIALVIIAAGIWLIMEWLDKNNPKGA